MNWQIGGNISLTITKFMQKIVHFNKSAYLCTVPNEERSFVPRWRPIDLDRKLWANIDRLSKMGFLFYLTFYYRRHLRYLAYEQGSISFRLVCHHFGSGDR